MSGDLTSKTLLIRLRDWQASRLTGSGLTGDAADEIERLQREVARLVEANEAWHQRVIAGAADEPATARVLLRQLLNAIHIAWTTRQLSNAWMERPEIPKLLLDADRAAAPPHCNPERTAQPPEPAHDLNELLEIARDIASMDCFHAANGWCEPECPCLAARAGRAVHRAPPTKSDGAS